MKRRRYAMFAEQTKIYEVLSRKLVKTNTTDKDGRIVWRYAEGYNDAKIAAEVSPELTRSHVLAVRQEMFGPVKGAEQTKPAKTPTPSAGKLEALDTRIANLERLVRYLCESLGVPHDPNTGT